MFLDIINDLDQNMNYPPSKLKKILETLSHHLLKSSNSSDSSHIWILLSKCILKCPPHKPKYPLLPIYTLHIGNSDCPLTELIYSFEEISRYKPQFINSTLEHALDFAVACFTSNHKNKVSSMLPLFKYIETVMTHCPYPKKIFNFTIQSLLDLYLNLLCDCDSALINSELYGIVMNLISLLFSVEFLSDLHSSVKTWLSGVDVSLKKNYTFALLECLQRHPQALHILYKIFIEKIGKESVGTLKLDFYLVLNGILCLPLTDVSDNSNHHYTSKDSWYQQVQLLKCIQENQVYSVSQDSNLILQYFKKQMKLSLEYFSLETASIMIGLWKVYLALDYTIIQDVLDSLWAYILFPKHSYKSECVVFLCDLLDTFFKSRTLNEFMESALVFTRESNSINDNDESLLTHKTVLTRFSKIISQSIGTSSLELFTIFLTFLETLHTPKKRKSSILSQVKLTTLMLIQSMTLHIKLLDNQKGAFEKGLKQVFGCIQPFLNPLSGFPHTKILLCHLNLFKSNHTYWKECVNQTHLMDLLLFMEKHSHTLQDEQVQLVLEIIWTHLERILSDARDLDQQSLELFEKSLNFPIQMSLFHHLSLFRMIKDPIKTRECTKFIIMESFDKKSFKIIYNSALFYEIPFIQSEFISVWMECIQQRLGLSIDYKKELKEKSFKHFELKSQVDFDNVESWVARLGLLPVDYLLVKDKRILVKFLLKLETVEFSNVNHSILWIAMIRSLLARWIPHTLDQFPLLESPIYTMDYLNCSLRILKSDTSTNEITQRSFFKDTSYILEYTWTRMSKNRLNMNYFIQKVTDLEWNEFTMEWISSFIIATLNTDSIQENGDLLVRRVESKILETPISNSCLNVAKSVIKSSQKSKERILNHFTNEFLHKDHSPHTRASLFVFLCHWMDELDYKEILSKAYTLLDNQNVSKACLSLPFVAQECIKKEIISKLYLSKDSHLIFLIQHLQMYWSDRLFTLLLNHLFSFVCKTRDVLLQILSSLTEVVKSKNILIQPLHASLLMNYLLNTTFIADSMSLEVFKSKTILLNALVRHQREALIQVIPSFIQVLVDLLQNFKYGELEAFHYSQIMSSMIQKPSREYLESELATLNASFIKPFSKYAPFLLLEFLKIQSSSFPFKGSIKSEFIQGMYALLDCCQEHGHEYILCQLDGSSGARPLFKNLISDWERCHRYKGKD